MDSDVARTGLSFVWLEITGLCQLECEHCYAVSGPAGDHGSMEPADWRRVIDEVVGLGVGMVQFIGGEPTLHPAFPELLDHALGCGLEVEVFSNLVRMTPATWDLMGRRGVRLATSYYSDRACEHEWITNRRGSHARTRANIAEAVRRSVPLRVGVIDVGAEQRSEHAVADLRALGVVDVDVDRLREVGRGVRGGETGVAQLCGRCGEGVVAISASGEVWPCVFSRWLPIGNVRDRLLSDVLASETAHRVIGELTAQTASRAAACQPTCSPSCSPTCNPIACNPRGCWPAFSRSNHGGVA
ncbi:MAG: radical SAM/SPASM domain-containing protein [Solirubrobacteraceae bacterium]